MNDLGWLSRGPTKRARAKAAARLAAIVVRERGDSGLPPDPPEPPPLPPPPPRKPDTERRGRR